MVLYAKRLNWLSWFGNAVIRQLAKDPLRKEEGATTSAQDLDKR